MRDGSAVIVTVRGEIDAGSEESWNFLLTRMAAAATAPGPFVVDVRNLRFMAFGAFPILARVAQRCRRRGFNLCLVSDRPATARTVAACGLRPVLMIHPTVEAALSQPAVARGRAVNAVSHRRPPGPVDRTYAKPGVAQTNT